MAVVDDEILRAKQQSWNVFAGRKTAPLSDDVVVLVAAPVTALASDADVNRQITTPLREGLLDAVWRPDVFIAGRDGDDIWVAHTGTMTGMFVAPLWGVPPSGRRTEVRYGEFTRVADGRVVELRVLADLPALAAQSGWHLFPEAGPLPRVEPQRPSELVEPDRDDDPAVDAATAVLTDRFDRWRAQPTTPAARELFHPDVTWRGCHGLGQADGRDRLNESFTALVSGDYADLGEPADVRVVEAEFSAMCRWPDPSRSTGGEGGPTLPWMTFLTRRDDRISGSWLLADLIHAEAQRGVELLDRSL